MRRALALLLACAAALASTPAMASVFDACFRARRNELRTATSWLACAEASLAPGESVRLV